MSQPDPDTPEAISQLRSAVPDGETELMAQPPDSTLKSVSLYAVAQGLRMVVPLATIAVFTRLIEPRQYGVLEMLNVGVAVAVGLGNWGLPAAFNRFFFAYAPDRAKQIRLLSTIVTFSILAFLVIGALVLLFRNLLSLTLTQSSGWGWLLIIMLATRICNHLMLLLLSALRNSEQAVAYTRYDVTQLLISTATSLVLVVGLRYGIVGLVVGQFSGHAFVFVLLTVRFGLRRICRIHPGILKECLSFSWPLMMGIWGSILRGFVDRYLIFVIAGLAVTGIYGRAFVIANMVFLLMTSVEHTYAPKWYKVFFKLDDGKRSTGSLFTEFVCITIVPPMLLVCLCQEVVAVLMPPSYSDAQSPATVLAACFAIMAFAKLQPQVLACLKMSKTAMVVNLSKSALGIGLSLVLIPMYGALGAAFGILITTALSIVAVEWILRRHHRVDYEWSKLARLFGLLAVAVVVALCCQRRLIHYVPGLVVRVLLLCGFAVVWTHIVGPAKLRNIWRRALTWARRGRTSSV